MAPLSRTSKKTVEPDSPDFSDFELPEAGPAQTPPKPVIPPDPVAVAVRRLIRKSLANVGITIREAARDGAVTVVKLASADWTDAAVTAWTVVARQGGEAEDGFNGPRGWKRLDWVVWRPEAMPHPRELADAAETFAKALARWRHCAAFTPDLAWLPPDLTQAADHRLVLPALRPEDAQAVAQAVCRGRPKAALTEDQAADLTPRLLRLAHRPRQSAENYVRRLRELLEAERAAASATAPPSASIRESPRLDRLHGMPEAVAWGLALERDLKHYRAGLLPWAAVDRGLLLSGPPGCGKTLYARGLAATCNVPLVSGSYSQWHSAGNSHQGDLLKAMRKTFAEARDRAPCILFIDEVDSFPNRATISHHYVEWETQVVNALLAEIDGVEGRDGVVLVAACNHPERLDPALTRSGRLDRHIRVGLPDRMALAAMLREHAGDELPGEDFRGAALAAAGSSGADVERYVRGARRRARNAGRPLILGDLLDEIGGQDTRTAGDQETTAVHEAGHAIAMCELLPGTLRAVTLIGSGSRSGRTQGASDTIYLTTADVNRRLVMVLAGRAAEQVILKTVTSAAGGDDGSDLSFATHVAATAAASLGLDAKAGLVWWDVRHVKDQQRLLLQQPLIASCVRDMVEAAYADAVALMERRSAAVKKLASALLARRALDGEDVAAIIAECPKDSPPESCHER